MFQVVSHLVIFLIVKYLVLWTVSFEWQLSSIVHSLWVCLYLRFHWVAKMSCCIVGLGCWYVVGQNWHFGFFSVLQESEKMCWSILGIEDHLRTVTKVCCTYSDNYYNTHTVLLLYRLPSYLFKVLESRGPVHILNQLPISRLHVFAVGSHECGAFVSRKCTFIRNCLFITLPHTLWWCYTSTGTQDDVKNVLCAHELVCVQWQI